MARSFILLPVLVLALCVMLTSASLNSVIKKKKPTESKIVSEEKSDKENSKQPIRKLPGLILEEKKEPNHVRLPRNPKLYLPYSIPHKNGLQYRKRIYPNRNQLVGRLDKHKMKQKPRH